MKRSPLAAIRRFCIQCQGDSFLAVTECNDTTCPFHEYRHGVALEKGRHSPTKACRSFCHEQCQAGAGTEEVRTCGGDTAFLGPCPVFPFRMGTNPNISRETREKARQRELKKLAEGTNSLAKVPAHTPFDAPESTETGRAMLPLRAREPNQSEERTDV